MMAEGRLPASPNFVIPSSHPSIWDNFSHLWNIEMRSPSDCPDGSDPDALTQLCDDNTICVINPISSGRQSSIRQIERLDHAIGDLNAHRLRPVPLHIDAGDEGLLLPFTAPELIWDFRLTNVTSISAYCPDGSQTFPGTGFVCWRDRKCVPGGMLFAINYLGTEISQIGLNFSRSSDSLMEHYPRYVRLGYDGIRNAVLSRQH